MSLRLIDEYEKLVGMRVFQSFSYQLKFLEKQDGDDTTCHFRYVVSQIITGYWSPPPLSEAGNKFHEGR
jgi:hypothetical protein